MNRDPFIFYRALDPVQGSWDGYGYYPSADHDFLAFVSDAPTGASIQTPELIKEYWTDYYRSNSIEQEDERLAKLHMADAVNRMQDLLQKRSRRDGSTYQSTLTIVRKTGSRLLYCSIGDSILQISRGGSLYRLTDTEVWDGTQIIHAQQKTENRQKTAPLRFTGYAGEFVRSTDIGSFRLEPEDLLILQTDGAEDLLRPDRFLQLLRSGFDQLRKDAKEIFDPGRIKDDVTLLIIPVEVSPQENISDEIQSVHREIEHLKSGQREIRTDVISQKHVETRLQNIEGTLQQINGRIQKLSEQAGTQYVSRNVRASHAKKTLAWFPLILAFLLGLLTGLAFLFLTDIGNGVSTSEPVPLPKVPQSRRGTIAPPEIVPIEECTYVVTRGDSLQKISASRSVSVDDLLQWNPGLTRESALQIGQELRTCGGIP